MKINDLIKQELEREDNISIIVLVDNLIEQAYERRASDIHIDPHPGGLRIRFRLDGVLQDAYQFPKTVQSEVISRIKVIASLRTDEHQATHDGRFRHTLPSSGGTVDIRVAIAPTYHGENVVLRLLSDNAERFSLENLGFSQSDQEKVLEAVKKPSGMILVTGPTGSGKTTTLYTLIQMLNTNDVSVVTIEDPIEYAIDGVKQIQVNARVGLTFAAGLRTILRQDPNVIMVGEIRDSETASIAVNTALTGHLMLSTLHTNDAATTMPRLIDLKAESFLVASTISVAIGQRLVRKVCDLCKKSTEVTKGQAASLALLKLARPFKVGQEVFIGEGCKRCGNTGYYGRLCINEVLVADENIREAIARKASAGELKQIAIKSGMTTMLEDGFIKVRDGRTTIEEVLRVIHD